MGWDLKDKRPWFQLWPLLSLAAYGPSPSLPLPKNEGNKPTESNHITIQVASWTPRTAEWGWAENNDHHHCFYFTLTSGNSVHSPSLPWTHYAAKDEPSSYHPPIATSQVLGITGRISDNVPRFIGAEDWSWVTGQYSQPLSHIPWCLPIAFSKAYDRRTQKKMTGFSCVSL